MRWDVTMKNHGKLGWGATSPGGYNGRRLRGEEPQEGTGGLRNKGREEDEEGGGINEKKRKRMRVDGKKLGVGVGGREERYPVLLLLLLLLRLRYRNSAARYKKRTRQDKVRE